MTDSEPKSRQTLRIQQLLFGYDRGHTLLAASGSSAKKRAAAVLSDSDWDPRAASGTDSYLSGRPLSREKCYALMKTWRAPEMPRPGCVWSHVLLIEEADLSRITQLERLDELLKRPEAIGNYQAYFSDLKLDLASDRNTHFEPDLNIVTELVRIVYLDAYNPNMLTKPVHIEQGMLALWSQQWPAMRRRLSFRTASLTTKKSSTKSNFDIEFADFRNPKDRNLDVLLARTLRMINEDICSGSQSELRRFLWRYGADTDGHRDNLIRLAHLYRELNDSSTTRISVADIIDQIEDWYPLAKEAWLLKTDIAQPMQAEFSLVPELDQFEVVRALRTRSALEAFPELGPVDHTTVENWIAQRPSEMLRLLGATAMGNDPFAESLFAGISLRKNADFVWDLLSISGDAFLRASRGSIEHLVDKRIDALDDEILIALIESAKERMPTLKLLVPYLLMRKSKKLISLVYEEVSQQVADSVIEELAPTNLGRTPKVDAGWIECVKEQPNQITHFAKETVQRKSQLLVCRDLLNADTHQYPLEVWSKRMEYLENDLTKSASLDFKVFLLIQTLRYPGEGAEILLNDAFDVVYHALKNRQLPVRTEMYLSDFLPQIGWFNNWDKCLRLKTGVVRICKNLGMSRKATLAITSDADIRDELNQIWHE